MLALVACLAVTGCGSATHRAHDAVIAPTAFSACLVHFSDDAARPSVVGSPSSTPSSPTRELSIRFVPLARGVWSASAITAPRITVGFYRTHANANAAAAQIAGQPRLNTVVSYSGTPSPTQRELISACLTHALRFRPAASISQT